MTKDFNGLLDPRSIAVVGIGARVDGPARRIVANLLAFDFAGQIYLVNQKYETLLDLPCFPSLEAIGKPVDLCIVSVPAAEVAGVVRTAAGTGIRNFIILSSGFSETGEVGAALETEIREFARQNDLLIMGVNCSGSINLHTRTHLSFSAVFDSDPFLPGPVAYIGQSGAMGTIIYSLAVEHGIGFSHIISSGNETAQGLTEFLEHLIDDPNTRVIVAYAEQLKNGRRLLELSRKARAAGKHIVLFKSARADAGARAAVSHTGSMAANDAVCAALFGRTGIVKVRTLDQLVAVCKILLAERPVPAGRRAAILAVSGGTAVIAADLAEESGFSVPPLDEATKASLRQWLPDYASFENPIDITSGIFYQPDKFAKVLECLLGDPGIDLVVVYGAYKNMIAQRLAEASAPVLAGCRKYAAAAWISGGPNIAAPFTQIGVPYFDSLAECFDALDLVVPRQDHGAARHAAAPAGAEGKVGALKVLTEDIVKAQLRDYGVPVLEEVVAASASDAAAAAGRIGFPVALKVISPDIPHRAKVGGIALGLHSEEAVAAEFDAMLERVRERVPTAQVGEVVVQKMVGPGPELFLGMSHDPSFGPVFTFGLGGILTEALQQITFAPLPLAEADARALLRELPAVRTLLSFNEGTEEALAGVIARISDWCEAKGEGLRELDLNPIMLDRGKPMLIDGLAVVDPGHSPQGLAASAAQEAASA